MWLGFDSLHDLLKVQILKWGEEAQDLWQIVLPYWLDSGFRLVQLDRSEGREGPTNHDINIDSEQQVNNADGEDGGWE